MGAYSFLNVVGSLVGPGVTAQIASTAGVAAEGISAAYDGEKDTATTGADGILMHSLHASQTGRMTIRLLKTSPINATLNQAYNFQRQTAANWGQNTIRIVDKVRGDVASLRSAAFVKHGDNVWAENGNTLEWTFSGYLNETLGVGVPDINTP